jgi:hypothetical protein
VVQGTNGRRTRSQSSHPRRVGARKLSTTVNGSARAVFVEARRLVSASAPRSAAGKVERTKSMVLCYLFSRNLQKVEGQQFTLRAQKNSQDLVKITSQAVVPKCYYRIEARIHRRDLRDSPVATAGRTRQGVRGFHSGDQARQRCHQGWRSPKTKSCRELRLGEGRTCGSHNWRWHSYHPNAEEAERCRVRRFSYRRDAGSSQRKERSRTCDCAPRCRRSVAYVRTSLATVSMLASTVSRYFWLRRGW